MSNVLGDTTADPRTGPCRLDALAHPAKHGRSPRDRQRLPESRRDPGAWTRARRFVLALRGTALPEARVVITTAPGEEAQVDCGDGSMVRHLQTGKYRRTRLFVLTLGYSRKAVRLLAAEPPRAPHRKDAMRGSLVNRGKNRWALVLDHYVTDAAGTRTPKQRWIKFHGPRKEAEKKLTE